MNRATRFLVAELREPGIRETGTEVSTAASAILETMTPEERSARAKKASEAAAKVRTEKRLAAEGQTKPAKKADGKSSK